MKKKKELKILKSLRGSNYGVANSLCVEKNERKVFLSEMCEFIINFSATLISFPLRLYRSCTSNGNGLASVGAKKVERKLHDIIHLGVDQELSEALEWVQISS